MEAIETYAAGLIMSCLIYRKRGDSAFWGIDTCNGTRAFVDRFVDVLTKEAYRHDLRVNAQIRERGGLCQDPEARFTASIQITWEG
jgi:hypothetical protein